MARGAVAPTLSSAGVPARLGEIAGLAVLLATTRSVVTLRAGEDGVRAGGDVDVRRDVVEVMEAVDVVQEDGLGREADPTGETEEGRTHEDTERREEKGLADDDDPGGREEERVPEA